MVGPSENGKEIKEKENKNWTLPAGHMFGCLGVLRERVVPVGCQYDTGSVP